MRSGARRDTSAASAAAAASSSSSSSSKHHRLSGSSPQPPDLLLGSSPPPLNLSVPVPTLSEREQLKADFYKTYDVMTGVRIAATLGGFFSLMVFFVVYKSRCGRGKSISSGDIAAAAAELDAISELPFDGFYSLTAPRRSLGNMSAPAGVRTRFSTSSYVSVTDYLEPKSLPGSVLGFPRPPGWSEGVGGSDRPLPGVQRTENRGSSFLVVPGVRLSSTGSSSDSSYYLEHHGSVELSLPPAPRPRRCWRRSTIAAPAPHFSTEDYPIDINVIQPTPDISPCGSERQLYPRNSSHWSTCGGRLAAPLASLGCASLTDYPEADIRSIGSDSVFYHEDYLMSDSSEDAATCESSDTESASSDEVCASSAHRPMRIVQVEGSLPRSIPRPQEGSHFLQVPTSCVSPLGRWGGGTNRCSSPVPQRRGCETISEHVQAVSALQVGLPCVQLETPARPQQQEMVLRHPKGVQTLQEGLTVPPCVQLELPARPEQQEMTAVTLRHPKGVQTFQEGSPCVQLEPPGSPEQQEMAAVTLRHPKGVPNDTTVLSPDSQLANRTTETLF